MKTLTAKDAKYGFGRLIDLERIVEARSLAVMSSQAFANGH